MKVAFVVEDLDLGGAQRHTLGLARALSSMFQIELISLTILGPALISDGSGPPTTVLGGRGLDPRTWRRLAEALERSRPDVVVSINQVATIAVGAARLLGSHRHAHACVFHSTLVNNLAGWMRTLAFIPVAWTCDALIYVSSNQRTHWERLGLGARTVATIRNGVELARYTPPSPESRAAAKRALGIDPDALVLGMTAMFRQEKNHPMAIAALAILRARGVAAHLLFLGGGPTRPDCEAAVEARGLACAVTFAGERSDVLPVLAAYDAGLLTSFAIETLSLAALEVMALGAPMVMTDIGGAREIVEDGQSGFVVPVTDTALLADRLQALADPELRHRLGAAARRRVETHFDYGAMVDAYAALFRSLAR
jgi:glycosyltransferase involved in cell wall biosynthesis